MFYFISQFCLETTLGMNCENKGASCDPRAGSGLRSHTVKKNKYMAAVKWHKYAYSVITVLTKTS